MPIVNKPIIVNMHDKSSVKTMPFIVGVHDKNKPDTMPIKIVEPPILLTPNHSNGERRQKAGQHSSSHMSGGRGGR